VAKLIKQWEARSLMEKGTRVPDVLCCNYRADCNRLAGIPARLKCARNAYVYDVGLISRNMDI
jgi:hypothetical protein